MVSPGGGRRELESGSTNILPPPDVPILKHICQGFHKWTLYPDRKGGTQLNLRQEEFFFFFFFSFSFSFFFFLFLFLFSFFLFLFLFLFSFSFFFFLFLLIINDTNINDINI